MKEINRTIYVVVLSLFWVIFPTPNVCFKSSDIATCLLVLFTMVVSFLIVCNKVAIYTVNKKQTKEVVEELFGQEEEIIDENTNTIGDTTISQTIDSQITAYGI